MTSIHPTFAETTTTLLHPPTSGKQWWRDAVIYQIYPRSFADGDGDGVGDLPGITARLGHLASLGVDAVWISPFYTSPQHDGGYDVADYRDIDPVFGTLADADALLAEAERLGIRVIIDLVPNHTSSAHPWFRAAVASEPDSAERTRYVFRDGRGQDGEEPPNNWQSAFGGPAWTRLTTPDGTPEQWYLHLFDVTQPDLNWENPEIHAEFTSILRFWLDRGVAGFRIDVANALVKGAGLPDWSGTTEILEGVREGTAGSEGDPTDAGQQGPMWDQEGVHEIYRSWNRVLAEYEGDRVLVAEAWVEPVSRLARYVRPDENHQAFNFEFLTSLWTAPALRDVVTASLEANDAVDATTTWVLSNHDVVRHPSRLGLEVPGGKPDGIGKDDPQPDNELGVHRGRAATLLMLALPGSAYLYQGEELGLPEHTTLDDDERADPTWRRSGHTLRGRDGCRVPLPWVADAPGFGFSPTGQSWLTQPEWFAYYALDTQVCVAGSTFEMYRTALRLRREFQLGSGSLAWVDGLAGSADDVLAFVNREVLVVTNLGELPVTLPEGLEVQLASAELPGDGVAVTVPTDVTVWLRQRS